MELREYARAIRRNWLLILVIVGLTVGVTAALTGRSMPTYRASTVLFLSPDPANSDPDVAAQRLQSYVALIEGPGIARAVAEELRLPLTTEEIQEKIDAEVEPGTVLIVVSATDGSPTRARDIVTAAAGQLSARVRELEPAPPQASPPPVSISVAQPTITSRTPQRLLRNLGFAAVLGLLLGAGASAARQMFFGTVHNAEDVRRFAGLETVGVISRRSEFRNAAAGGGYHPDSLLAEAFRKLRAGLPARMLPGRVGAGRAPGEPVSLVLTSAVPREGTTAIACGLAIALAETGSAVVLVDANLREPGVSAFLAINATRGLSDVLTGIATIDDVLYEWGNCGLQVIPAGPVVASPGELVAAPVLADTIRTLEQRFDVVLIDAPPLLPVADAVILGTLTSGVLLVVRAGETRIERMVRAVGLLRGVGAQLVGAVLNALPRKWRGTTPWWRTGLSRRRRSLVGGAVLPARPISRVPPGDASVMLSAGTARGVASVLDLTREISTDRDKLRTDPPESDPPESDPEGSDPPGSDEPEKRQVP